MPTFIEGATRFKQQVYPDNQALFQKLAKGQHPEACFITCADSRVVPHLLTQTQPGDLFCACNPGNLVPPADAPASSEAASLEYAVSALNVANIVVCGHTSCGAMQGLLQTEAVDALAHVKNWIQPYGAKALARAHKLGDGLNEAERLQCLIEQNVLLQLEHVASYPFVASRLEAGELTLHGWVYDIEHGDLQAYDFEQKRFLPIAE